MKKFYSCPCRSLLSPGGIRSRGKLLRSMTLFQLRFLKIIGSRYVGTRGLPRTGNVRRFCNFQSPFARQCNICHTGCWWAQHILLRSTEGYMKSARQPISPGQDFEIRTLKAKRFELESVMAEEEAHYTCHDAVCQQHPLFILLHPFGINRQRSRGRKEGFRQFH